MENQALRARFALILLVLAALACNSLAVPVATVHPAPTATAPAGPTSSAPALTPAAAATGAANVNTILAVAVRLDGSQPTLVGYLGDPAQAPFQPPAGRYYVDVLDSNGLTLSLGAVNVAAGTAVPLPASVAAAGGKADPTQASLLATLGKFLIEAELAKLTAYDAASKGFSAPLFAKAVQPGQDSLDQLYAHYDELGRQEQSVLAAADALQTQVPAAFARPGGGAGWLAALAPGQAPRPAARQMPGLKDALLGFFGYARDTGLRARQRIIQISAGLSPGDKADAFDALRSGFKSDAQNFDDLLAQLATGKLDNQAAQMESDLRNSPTFAAAAQQANDTVGQIVKREGGELVTKGVELQVEVIKTVLGKLSPDLTKGYDLAEKGAKWAQYVQDFYNNPLNAAEQLTREQLTEKIKERIASDLADCCPGIPSDIADQIAGTVSEQAVGAIPQLTLDSTAIAATAAQHSVETQQAQATAQQQTAEAAAQQTAEAAAQQTAEAAAQQAAAATQTEIARRAAQAATTVPTVAPQPVNITSEGSVFASSTADGYPAQAAVDGDRTTSWFSTGPDPNGKPTTFTWTGTKDDLISNVSIFSNSQNSNPDFREGYYFSGVTVEVLDASGSVVFQKFVSLAGTPDPDVSVQPNVLGRTVLLLFTGSESQDCGGFSEFIVTALR